MDLEDVRMSQNGNQSDSQCDAAKHLPTCVPGSVGQSCCCAGAVSCICTIQLLPGSHGAGRQASARVDGFCLTSLPAHILLKSEPNKPYTPPETLNPK